MIKRFFIPSGYRRITRASKKSKMILLVVTVMCASYMIKKGDIQFFSQIWNEVKNIFSEDQFKEIISFISSHLAI